jgi:hypothetical protein
MRRNILLTNKRLFIGVAFGVLLSFILGWVVAFNFSGSYETGYKMAYLEMQQLLKEGVKGKTDFYIQGLDSFKFYPRSNDTIAITLEDRS